MQFIRAIFINFYLNNFRISLRSKDTSLIDNKYDSCSKGKRRVVLQYLIHSQDTRSRFILQFAINNATIHFTIKNTIFDIIISTNDYELFSCYSYTHYNKQTSILIHNNCSYKSL